ncbi:calcium-binding protein [Iningainema tapete]|uniref:Hemolysin n=1 Tax=Iningainema tapete BLCC-T55 TaxID=2748662 RepID=A0A8J7C8K6_9CYAN|nr:hemolysin [Iningainema tapete]MBD2776909.1 hemolysin [Iningainema tapete BLCC-T55]
MAIYNGTNGSDVIFGSSEDDTINGFAGNDSLSGGAGNDILRGGTGDDTLFGGAGDDILIGAGGGSIEFDTLVGNAGSDIFVLGDNSGIFYTGSGYAAITDWQPGIDRIQVSGSINFYTISSQNLIGSSALDTGIYFGNDLIGVVQDSTDVIRTADFFVAA